MMAKRVAWMTDIHVNFLNEERVRAFHEQITAASPEVVLIGGDIAEADTLVHDLIAMHEAIDVPIYFVLGNHDYYRGSIEGVRQSMRQLTASSPGLQWLPACGPVKLGEDVALVGHGGWGDARLGNFDRSDVKSFLSDHALIRELRRIDLTDVELKSKLMGLGDDAAGSLRKALTGVSAYRKIIVLTHVPPFRESCWHEGAISNDDWLPHFTCKAVGDVLHDVATSNPGQEFLVLCGHTHSGGDTKILPNLEVRTGAADYGRPDIQDVIEV